MSSARITIPYPEEDAKLLKGEAKRQERNFSNYMQTLITDHIDSLNKERTDGINVEQKKSGNYETGEKDTDQKDSTEERTSSRR